MSQGALARRLGTGDAVVIGLGSMIGAGVFAAFGPAARAAYAIANAAAFTQPPEQRCWPRWLNGLGGAGCVVLVATLGPLSCPARRCRTAAA